MFKGWSTVLKFTFRHRAGTRGYLIATIGVALLLSACIAGGMLIADNASKGEAKTTRIERVICVSPMDLSSLAYFPGTYSGIKYESAESAEAACETAGKLTLVAALDEGTISVIMPEGTDITKSDAEGYSDFAGEYAAYAMSAGSAPVYSHEALQASEESGTDAVRNVLSFVLPYATMMLMYFMVLIYGQGVANSVVSEKSGKLMDMFLISVKPAGVILGKTAAIAIAGILQVAAWALGIVGGLIAGKALVLAVNPISDMALIEFMNSIGVIGGLFTPAGALVAALIIILGFFLYCGLAAIGGAAASKPEDLGTTNMLFTLLLVASFFLCMYGGAMEGTLSGSSKWLAFMPFSAIMVSPGNVLLGGISAVEGLISCALILAAALLITYAAGKVYAMMVFYRGNPLNPKKLFALLKSRKDA